jgi:hypothetical protein
MGSTSATAIAYPEGVRPSVSSPVRKVSAFCSYRHLIEHAVETSSQGLQKRLADVGIANTDE